MPAWSPVQDLPLAPVRFTGPTADHFRAILNPRNLVMLQPAREQFAAPFEDRIGGGRKVSVDPFQILHDVEEELANRDGLCPAGTPVRNILPLSVLRSPGRLLFPRG